MFGTDTVAYYWHMWLNFVGGLGLPWDRHITAYALLALLFYAIGFAFKALTQR